MKLLIGFYGTSSGGACVCVCVCVCVAAWQSFGLLLCDYGTSQISEFLANLDIDIAP